MGNSSGKKKTKIKMTKNDFNKFVSGDKNNIDSLKKKYNIPIDENSSVIKNLLEQDNVNKDGNNDEKSDGENENIENTGIQKRDKNGDDFSESE